MAQSQRLSLQSPYAPELEIYIDNHNEIEKLQSKSGTGLSPTDKRTLGKEWMATKLLHHGPTIKTGQSVYEFVTFEDLDYSKDEYAPAISEMLKGDIPTLKDFYVIFSIMCHLNDKAVDPDKLCTPRRSRLIAVFNELSNPGSTMAPEGYAGDNNAGWTHEVKQHWALENNLPRKKNEKSHTVQLESAYRIIAKAHIKTTDSGENKHLGRDETQIAVRKLYQSFPTQIIKDFVAACPGCNKSDKRKSRRQGAKKTREKGGNRGIKKRSRTEFESSMESPDNFDDIDDYSPSNERTTKEPRRATMNLNYHVQMDNLPNDDPLHNPAFGADYPQQFDPSFQYEYPVQPFGALNSSSIPEQPANYAPANEMTLFIATPQYLLCNGAYHNNPASLQPAPVNHTLAPGPIRACMEALILLKKGGNTGRDIDWKGLPCSRDEIYEALRRLQSPKTLKTPPSHSKQPLHLSFYDTIDPKFLEKQHSQQAFYDPNTGDIGFGTIDINERSMSTPIHIKPHLGITTSALLFMDQEPNPNERMNGFNLAHDDPFVGQTFNLNEQMNEFNFDNDEGFMGQEFKPNDDMDQPTFTNGGSSNFDWESFGRQLSQEEIDFASLLIREPEL